VSSTHLSGMFQHGFPVIERWSGIPLRVHGSTPLVALVFGGFRFVPEQYGWGSFCGSARLRRMTNAWPTVDMMAIGGGCTWRGEVTAVKRACIAGRHLGAAAAFGHRCGGTWRFTARPRRRRWRTSPTPSCGSTSG
jgi:hypothetical protein